MYFDFMSYVAQKLCNLYGKGKSIIEGRIELTEVITECSIKFIHNNEELVHIMYAIVNESVLS